MITISTGSLYFYGLERIFKVASAAGFDGLELMFRPYTEGGHFEYWSHENLMSLQQKYKLPIHSLHIPVHFEKNPELYFSDLIKIGERLGVNNRIVFHTSDPKYPAYNPWFEQQIKNGLKDYLIENVGRLNSIEKITPDNFPNFCVDVTHSMITGEDTLAVVKTINNIKQFHLSYFDGKQGHRNILENTELISNIIRTHPNTDRCLEIYPNAFPNFNNEEEVILILRKTKQFLENI